MLVDYQILFNIVVGISLGLVGWIAGRFTKALDTMERDIRMLPHNYVIKADYIRELHDINEKLDKIWDKIDGKADK